LLHLWANPITFMVSGSITSVAKSYYIYGQHHIHGQFPSHPWLAPHLWSLPHLWVTHTYIHTYIHTLLELLLTGLFSHNKLTIKKY